MSLVPGLVDFVCQDGAYCGIMAKPSAANKGQPTVNYHQSLAFDHSYLSCNDHCDQWLFQEIFFY